MKSQPSAKRPRTKCGFNIQCLARAAMQRNNPTGMPVTMAVRVVELSMVVGMEIVAMVAVVAVGGTPHPHPPHPPPTPPPTPLPCQDREGWVGWVGGGESSQFPDFATVWGGGLGGGVGGVCGGGVQLSCCVAQARRRSTHTHASPGGYPRHSESSLMDLPGRHARDGPSACCHLASLRPSWRGNRRGPRR